MHSALSILIKGPRQAVNFKYMCYWRSMDCNSNT